MRLLHSLAKTHATFDDPNLVSHAGLLPVMALAGRAGLGGEVRLHLLREAHTRLLIGHQAAVEADEVEQPEDRIRTGREC